MDLGSRFFGRVICLMALTGAGWGQNPALGKTAYRDESPYIPGGRPVFLTLPSAKLAPGEIPARSQVPLWSGSFSYNGTAYSYSMVGTNPASGSATTSIPLVIIPLEFVFADGTTLSATQTVCGDTADAVMRVVDSPLIAKAFRFAPGGANLGTTQYIDAFQRANFWSIVSGAAPNYHVLFSPVLTEPVQTVTVLHIDGKTVAGPCSRIGEVEFNFFDGVAQSLIKKLGIAASQLPVFLDYNSFLTAGGCCIEGYHAVTASDQTYAMAVYSDPGIFRLPIEDIHALSHELGEWVDDPFGNNMVPAWGHVGQVGGCQSNLEVGDPLTGHDFTATLNGFTYHPQDLVFLPWYARSSPSTSVNGWYTFMNEFAKPPKLCQ